MFLYNSLTRKKEKFAPHKGKKVSIYACGITPYDTTHLGHAFTYVFFDALIRYLKFKGYKIKYAQNVTDIDDDILKKAKETNQNWKRLGNFWTQRFLSDMRALNVLPPTYYIKATNSVGKIIEAIRSLLKKGLAYEKGGNIYFEVKKFKDYGKLSRFTEKQMLLIAKERGGNIEDPLKKHSLDFVLWQKSKPGEPKWKSPWSNGRPGWHIECSAMINQYLGKQIDIHGGGKDLIFPHHESEIAQSESFTRQKPFVKYWMHTSMVLYEGEKMSKSLGNLVLVSDLLKKHPGDAIRCLLLSHHYRAPWEYDNKEFLKVTKDLNIIKKALKTRTKKTKSSPTRLKELTALLEDDFNSPRALNLLILWSLIIIKEKDGRIQEDLKNGLALLGFSNKLILGRI